MLKKLLFFCLLIWVCEALAQDTSNDRGYIVKVGDKAPDFTVKLANGQSFTLSQHLGKIIMLQFTASWCGVCRREMPFIEDEIYRELKDKNFVLLGLDNDEPIEKVNLFAEQTKISYPLALDTGGEVFMKYAHKKAGITRNVIIDSKGKIVYLTRLFNPEEFDEMKKVLFQLVD